MNQSQRIGWIGTGVMGGPMCGHLMDHGYPMTVYNRSRERAAPLVQRGARWAEPPPPRWPASRISSLPWWVCRRMCGRCISAKPGSWPGLGPDPCWWT
jgi:hypothetical protein